MKPSVPEPMAGEMAATKGKVLKMWPAGEMMNGPEMTGDMRCREVASAPKVRTAAETTAPTEVAGAAKARATTAEVTSAAKMRGAPKVRTAAAEMTSATSEMTGTATREMTAAASEMTTAMRRGDRYRRATQGKRRNDCQHCPAHIFLTVSGDKAKRAAAGTVALKYRKVAFCRRRSRGTLHLRSAHWCGGNWICSRGVFRI